MSFARILKIFEISPGFSSQIIGAHRPDFARIFEKIVRICPARISSKKNLECLSYTRADPKVCSLANNESFPMQFYMSVKKFIIFWDFDQLKQSGYSLRIIDFMELEKFNLTKIWNFYKKKIQRKFFMIFECLSTKNSTWIDRIRTLGIKYYHLSCRLTHSDWPIVNVVF